MEDSMKGLLITVTVISIFIMGVMGFLKEFPENQGVTFSGQNNNTYLITDELFNNDPEQSLELVQNQTDIGFDQWDIEIGFMGSNTQKGSKEGTASYIRYTFTQLTTMANEIFGENSPVLIVLGILLTLSLTVGTYIFIKFIRTGS